MHKPAESLGITEFTLLVGGGVNKQGHFKVQDGSHYHLVGYRKEKSCPVSLPTTTPPIPFASGWTGFGYMVGQSEVWAGFHLSFFFCRARSALSRQAERPLLYPAIGQHGHGLFTG